jgi:hypothetical protein
MPLYETEADRKAEQEIADAIEKRWPQLRLEKMNPQEEIDRKVWIGSRHIGWIEIKDRKNYTYDQLLKFGDVILDASKWHRGCAHTHAGKKTLFFIRDIHKRIFYVPVSTKTTVTLGVGGRRDRGDPYDIDNVAHIPIGAFKEMLYGSLF